MQGFKSATSAQRLLTTHAAVYNTFNTQRRLIHRLTLRRFRVDANAAWAAATAWGVEVLDLCAQARLA